MRGYEKRNDWLTRFDAGLRIPMRGYEALSCAVMTVILLVTNPHAGL